MHITNLHLDVKWKLLYLKAYKNEKEIWHALSKINAKWQTKKEKLNKWKQSTTIASSVTKEMELGIKIVTHHSGMPRDMVVEKL